MCCVWPANASEAKTKGPNGDYNGWLHQSCVVFDFLRDPEAAGAEANRKWPHATRMLGGRTAVQKCACLWLSECLPDYRSDDPRLR